MKELAQNEIDLVRPKMVNKYGEDSVPERINIESEESIRLLYEFLRDERAEING